MFVLFQIKLVTFLRHAVFTGVAIFMCAFLIIF